MWANPVGFGGQAGVPRGFRGSGAAPFVLTLTAAQLASLGAVTTTVPILSGVYGAGVTHVHITTTIGAAFTFAGGGAATVDIDAGTSADSTAFLSENITAGTDASGAGTDLSALSYSATIYLDPANPAGKTFADLATGSVTFAFVPA